MDLREPWRLRLSDGTDTPSSADIAPEERDALAAVMLAKRRVWSRPLRLTMRTRSPSF
jgi:hypothetical protein